MAKRVNISAERRNPMTINGIGGEDYAAYLTQNNTVSLESALAKIDNNEIVDEEAMNACKEFEVYMIEQMYKSMEKTVMKADEEEGEYEQYFGDMRIQEYAKAVSDQGKLGLAEQLYESMKRNQGVTIIVEDAAIDAATEIAQETSATANVTEE